MTNDDLDLLLGSRDEIVPRPGFTDAVMAVVRQTARETPPLRFPWERALLGPLMALLLVFVSFGSDVVKPATLRSTLSDLVGQSEILTVIGDAAIRLHVGWMGLAMLSTLASVALSSHLALRIEGHR